MSIELILAMIASLTGIVTLVLTVIGRRKDIKVIAGKIRRRIKFRVHKIRSFASKKQTRSELIEIGHSTCELIRDVEKVLRGYCGILKEINGEIENSRVELLLDEVTKIIDEVERKESRLYSKIESIKFRTWQPREPYKPGEKPRRKI